MKWLQVSSDLWYLTDKQLRFRWILFLKKLNSIPASISLVSSGFRFGLLRVVLSGNPPGFHMEMLLHSLLPLPGLNEGSVAYQLAREICPVFDQPPLIFANDQNMHCLSVKELHLKE